MTMRVTGLVLILLLLISGCGERPQPQRFGPDGQLLKVYRHSMDGAPTNLDPVQAATVYSNFMTVSAYDTLYSYKYLARPYVLKPNLAVAMPDVSEDGLTYTIKIKQGVRFIDDEAFADGKGRELTADDIVYSLKRHFDPANRSQGLWVWQGRIAGLDDWGRNGADYAKEVEGLKALDKYTLQITLNRPYPQLTYTLAMGYSAIVPHEAVATYGRELSVHPVGSGPFKLVRFDTAKAVFEPNPYFRQEPLDLKAEGFDPAQHAGLGLEALDGRSPPFVDRLEIDFIAETAARWNSFNKGNEVQYTSVPVEQTDTVLSSKQPVRVSDEWAKKYNWTSSVEAGLVYTAFNLGRPALGYNDDAKQNDANKALRCAIRKSFDWQARNDRFYSGIGVVFPGIISPAVPEFDPEQSRDSVTRDVEGAKALLKDAGWTADNLPTITYGFQNSVTSRQMFEQFRGFMVELGYPSAKIKPESFATFGDFNKAIKTNQLDVFGLGWGLDYPDAENTLQLQYGPNHTPGSNNFNYANPDYDALYKQAAVMQPGDERTALYRRMNEMAIDDCVGSMALSRNRIYLWHKDVIGLPDREILGGFWLRYVDVVQ